MKTKPIALSALLIAVLVGLPWVSVADPRDQAQPAVPPVHTVLEPPASRARPARDSAAALAAGWETIKAEDFEGTFPNDWDLRGDPTWDREWDDDPAHPELARWTGWCAGGGASGRTPGPFPWGQYAPDMNAWMIYGPFSLRGCSNGRVDFRYWLWSEPAIDWLLWSASTDGVNFHNLGATGGDMAWIDHTFWLDDVPALGHLGGKRQVWISFAFLSNDSVQFKGAYLDDIEVMRFRSDSPTNELVLPENNIVTAGSWHWFTTTWRDLSGSTELKQCYVHIGTSPTLANNVTLLYNAQSNKVWLRNDAGTAWLGGIEIYELELIENSQVLVSPGTMDVWHEPDGWSLSIVWNIAFKPAFVGTKKVGMKAFDRWGAKAPGQWMGTCVINP